MEKVPSHCDSGSKELQRQLEQLLLEGSEHPEIVSDESKPEHTDTGTAAVGQGQEEICSSQDAA